jgi:hypothetical protein
MNPMNDQRSVTDQLQDLITLANKNGLYDAADWVQSRMKVPTEAEATAAVADLADFSARQVVDDLIMYGAPNPDDILHRYQYVVEQTLLRMLSGGERTWGKPAEASATPTIVG